MRPSFVSSRFRLFSVVAAVASVAALAIGTNPAMAGSASLTVASDFDRVDVSGTGFTPSGMVEIEGFNVTDGVTTMFVQAQAPVVACFPIGIFQRCFTLDPGGEVSALLTTPSCNVTEEVWAFDESTSQWANGGNPVVATDYCPQ